MNEWKKILEESNNCLFFLCLVKPISTKVSQVQKRTLVVQLRTLSSLSIQQWVEKHLMENCNICRNMSINILFLKDTVIFIFSSHQKEAIISVNDTFYHYNAILCSVSNSNSFIFYWLMLVTLMAVNWRLRSIYSQIPAWLELNKLWLWVIDLCFG